MNRISFTVAGYPPAKSEAKSMLGPNHPHAARLRLLLEVAGQALDNNNTFVLVAIGPITLDLVVHAADQPPWDATATSAAWPTSSKTSPGATLLHLGDLVSVWLYRNDRQIKEIRYREVPADEVSYVLTVLGNLDFLTPRTFVHKVLCNTRWVSNATARIRGMLGPSRRARHMSALKSRFS